MAEPDTRELPSWTQLLAAIETIMRAGYTAEGLGLAVKVLGITEECRRALNGETPHG